MPTTWAKPRSRKSSPSSHWRVCYIFKAHVWLSIWGIVKKIERLSDFWWTASCGTVIACGQSTLLNVGLQQHHLRCFACVSELHEVWVFFNETPWTNRHPNLQGSLPELVFYFTHIKIIRLSCLEKHFQPRIMVHNVWNTWPCFGGLNKLSLLWDALLPGVEPLKKHKNSVLGVVLSAKTSAGCALG